MEIRTRRLRLIPCRAPVARAAVIAPERLSSLLGVRVDSEWPSEDLLEILPGWAEALASDPSVLGWGIWLILAGGELIGDVGFKGPPDEDGAVELGYGILSHHRNHGFATEAVRGLCGWAAADPSVRAIHAVCLRSNLASARVLEKASFQQIGSDESLLDWELLVR